MYIQLHLNDESATLVAQFYYKGWGLVNTPKPARIEIFPGGEDMADLIIVTLVYIEKMRLEREYAARGV